MRRNRSMGGGSKSVTADTRGPPHTAGIAPKAAALASLVAGAHTPPTSPTSTAGKLGGRHKEVKVASIPPPKLGLQGKMARSS